MLTGLIVDTKMKSSGGSCRQMILTMALPLARSAATFKMSCDVDNSDSRSEISRPKVNPGRNRSYKEYQRTKNSERITDSCCSNVIP